MKTCAYGAHCLLSPTRSAPCVRAAPLALHIVNAASADQFRWNSRHKKRFSVPRTTVLLLKRASLSRPSGEWSDDDFDVLADGAVVGRIFKANAAPVGSPWMWTLLFEHHKDRSPTHGYCATREAAMAAFAISWRRE
jgi:hypothetical protein